MEETLLNSLAISGYRSFGKNLQLFSKFEKITLLIGQNNCGKSNVLRFIHKHLNDQNRFDQNDKNLLEISEINYGHLLPAEKFEWFAKKLIKKFLTDIDLKNIGTIIKILNAKKNLDESSMGAWFIFNSNKEFDQSRWLESLQKIDDISLKNLWRELTQRDGGTRLQHWEPEVLNKIFLQFPRFKSSFIPAIREISKHNSEQDGFNGYGIIQELAKLQNPSADKQSDKEKFLNIEKFLRNVTNNSDLRIEIPFDRDTILVHSDGKTLPIESLGSGIHEVIILAAAATTIDNNLICMEEPELHLNPLLQKKLIKYLNEYTNNQYLITTHSAALMDTPGAEIYHLQLIDGITKVERVTSNRSRSEVCHDLGYHPSDLLQANSIIWVEGPSDRIYLNWWLSNYCNDLIEGIHYSVMFYGGKLASHLTAEDSDELITNFISLRQINRRACILMDSDKANARSKINSTKERLKKEFNEGPGFCWVTDGREIENYIEKEQLINAIKVIHPKATLLTNLEKFDNCLKIKIFNKELQASKIKVANYITSQESPNFGIYNLESNMEKILAFIRNSNP